MSKAFELVKLVWENGEMGHWTGKSGVNEVMRDALKLAIRSLIKFEKDDFETIYEKYRGAYWFGVNGNGKGMGEHLYSKACHVGNISACKSYEAFYDFKPFISSKGFRANRGSCYLSNERRYEVTGFDFETKKIHLVSYEKSDWDKKGKKQLHSFDNKEWNEFRKQLIEL